MKRTRWSMGELSFQGISTSWCRTVTHVPRQTCHPCPRTKPTVTLTWMSNAGQWNASGQIPLREVEAGRLDRFGTLDPFEGGATQRHGLSLAFEGADQQTDFRVLAYAFRYDFRLYSDFTYFLKDPVFGDMIKQTDDRTVVGVDARTSFHHHIQDMRFQTTVGLQTRADNIDNGLFHDSQRERLSTTVDAGVEQTAIGFFAEEEARFTRWFTLTAGIRLDRADVSVEDRRSDAAQLGGGVAGAQGATLLCPKATAVFSRSWTSRTSRRRPCLAVAWHSSLRTSRMRPRVSLLANEMARARRKGGSGRVRGIRAATEIAIRLRNAALPSHLEPFGRVRVVASPTSRPRTHCGRGAWLGDAQHRPRHRQSLPLSAPR
jgi:outer membrane receptor protein involved in Fe transport